MLQIVLRAYAQHNKAFAHFASAIAMRSEISRAFGAAARRIHLKRRGKKQRI